MLSDKIDPKHCGMNKNVCSTICKTTKYREKTETA